MLRTIVCVSDSNQFNIKWIEKNNNVISCNAIVPCVRQLAEEPADFRDGVTGGDAPHLSVDGPLLGDDDRFALQGAGGLLASTVLLFHYKESGKLQLLTADVHVEDVVDGRVVVIDGEGVDPALCAEDPH